MKRESLEEIAEKEGENNPLFAAIRREAVIREFPMVIETTRALAERKVKIGGGGYDMTQKINEKLMLQ